MCSSDLALCDGRGGADEDACPDDAADAERHQRQWSKRSLQRVLAHCLMLQAMLPRRRCDDVLCMRTDFADARIRDQPIDRLGSKK